MRRAFLLAVLVCFAAGCMFLVVRRWPHKQATAPPPPETRSEPALQWQLGERTKESGCVANRATPDSACTPGAVFAHATVEQICTPYYTKKVRNVPLSVRKKAFAAYGIPMERASDYELDHHISLELGGSNDIANLWPEAYTITDGARIKDVVENYLHRQVCKGAMTLQEAQYRIATDWKAVYREMPPRKHRKKRTSGRAVVARLFSLCYTPRTTE